MRGAVIRLERQLTELQLQQVAAQKAAASSPASTSAESDGVQTPCSANVEVTPAHSGQSLDLDHAHKPADATLMLDYKQTGTVTASALPA